VPELKGPDDTTYFEDEELPDLPPGFHMKHTKKGFSGENFPFIGYSFSRSLGIFNLLWACSTLSDLLSSFLIFRFLFLLLSSS